MEPGECVPDFAAEKGRLEAGSSPVVSDYELITAIFAFLCLIRGLLLLFL